MSSMPEPPDGKNSSLFQKATVSLITAAIALYLLLVVTGKIHKDNRLTAAELGSVAVAALAMGLALRPDFLDRVQKFDFAGVKVELVEVKKGQIEVQKQQQEQQAVLDDVRLALRLLIGEPERAHLLNLFRHTTSDYWVHGAVRDEIRRLRAMKLIRIRDGKTVGGMPVKTAFDLSDHVQLTEDGFRFISRLTTEG